MTNFHTYFVPAVDRYDIAEYDQFSVKKGDVLGFYFPDSNPIPYDEV